MFLPKTLISPKGSACRGEQGGQGCVLFFVTYSDKKKSTRCILDHVTSFIPIWFTAQKADLWHKWCIRSRCRLRREGALTAGLYINNLRTVLMSSLLALFVPLPSPWGGAGGNMKIFSGAGAGGRKSWECCHLYYWPSKNRVRLLTLRAQLSWPSQNQGAGWLATIVQSTKSLFSFPQAA